MGRRRLWTLVGLLLAALAGTILVGALRRSAAPFDFLNGHEPVAVEGSPDPFMEYSFRTEVNRFYELAGKELRERGFSVNRDMVKERFISRRLGRAEVVEITKNMHAVPDRTGRYGETMWLREKGWVTVSLFNFESPSIWDRIKSVFGL